MKITDLRPDPQNRRLHNPKNRAMVVDALKAVRAARSIVISQDNVILAGNGVAEGRTGCRHRERADHRRGRGRVDRDPAGEPDSLSRSGSWHCTTIAWPNYRNVGRGTIAGELARRPRPGVVLRCPTNYRTCSAIRRPRRWTSQSSMNTSRPSISVRSAAMNGAVRSDLSPNSKPTDRRFACTESTGALGDGARHRKCVHQSTLA